MMDVEEFKKLLIDKKVFQNIMKGYSLSWYIDDSGVHMSVTYDELCDTRFTIKQSVLYLSVSIDYSGDGRFDVYAVNNYEVYKLYDILVQIARLYAEYIDYKGNINVYLNNEINMDLSLMSTICLLYPNTKTVDRYLLPGWTVSTDPVLPFAWKLNFLKDNEIVATIDLSLSKPKKFYKFDKSNILFINKKYKKNRQVSKMIYDVCSVYLKVSNANLATDINDLKIDLATKGIQVKPCM